MVRRLAGRPADVVETLEARLPMRVNSERGRTEYVLVGLVADGSGYVAYPVGKSSGSITAYAHADGFVVVPRQTECLDAGSTVAVRLLGSGRKPADLVVIGSHCTGLDAVLGELRKRGYKAKTITVGSSGGLEAARRGDCDAAGIHLLDPATDEYNRPFVPANCGLVPGYGRMQGLVFRPDDARFAAKPLAEATADAAADPSCRMVNRNRGSGTRIVIDGLLKGTRPPGYHAEARSHSAVAAAVAQGRADWGVAIAPVAAGYRLGFLPIRPERFDFVVPLARWDKPAVAAFRDVLESPAVRAQVRRSDSWCPTLVRVRPAWYNIATTFGPG